MIPLSICIPTYEMRGLGHIFLAQSFDILARQTFKDFDIIISDHSQDDAIENVCALYKEKLDIKYYRNEAKRGNSSANINNAIAKAEGALIKILFQDDFLANDTALQKIVEYFDPEHDHWLVTACEHSIDGVHYIRPFYPRYNDRVHLGKNTISSPSVLTIKNDAPLLFDEHLLWLMDVDYYKRCYTTFGKPKILNEINVVNRLGAHQVTNYILKKYYL
jgi:glycosyltransferase involved in cell wall biosynthesis